MVGTPSNGPTFLETSALLTLFNRRGEGKRKAATSSASRLVPRQSLGTRRALLSDLHSAIALQAFRGNYRGLDGVRPGPTAQSPPPATPEPHALPTAARHENTAAPLLPDPASDDADDPPGDEALPPPSAIRARDLPDTTPNSPPRGPPSPDAPHVPATPDTVRPRSTATARSAEVFRQGSVTGAPGVCGGRADCCGSRGGNDQGA